MDEETTVELSRMDEALRAIEPVKKPHKRRNAIIVAVIALILVGSVSGAAWGASQYYSQRVAPGVSLGNVSLAGQSKEDVARAVQSSLKTTKVSFTVGSQTKTVSLAQLGIKADTRKSVDAVLKAKSNSGLGGALNRINPFAHKNVNIITEKINATALNQWAQKQFLTQDDLVQEAGVAYNSQTQKFEAQLGKPGKGINTQELVAVVQNAVAHTGTTTSATISEETVPSAVSDETAQQTADAANARLNTPVKLNNGQGKAITVDRATLATWMTYAPDMTNGTLNLTVNKDAVAQYVSAHSTELNQDKVDEVQVKNAAGKVFATVTQGRKGVAVKEDQSATVEALEKALAGTEATSVTVAADVIDFKTNVRVADYDSPNGDAWMKVDLSAQRAYAYRGSTLVREFIISSGANTPDKTSDDGTFFINIKYTSQTMRGPGYVTPGVQWVSYYNGGEAFHAAPWALDNIAKGRPGSHGCINMYEQDAKWVYDFAQPGTMVQVVGSTPMSPVRE
ncbi:L,D-transpeptidase family protein [Alloscardovia venturai]|uniref:L,D-transpeptidase family protein n=1 Tax=Alloscardovia venturai TaxID=1769421 RepID=A0ABW2Y219_9BIFI